jgi:ABC-type nickel/cobalt efflux system permease component RcnA
METIGLALIFWYGILHAFAPDHLTAIADFSIGKNKQKTMLITILFALGHGLTLFIFAKVLQTYIISDDVLNYGDIISSSIIILMGIYLLYMVYFNKIHLKKHIHNKKEHIHIYFGSEHNHNSTDTKSAFTIGALMGIGGVRGMLITLGVINGQNVDFTMVLAFTLGVMIIFVGFGIIISYINANLLTNKKNISFIFTATGVMSLLVGLNMLLG